VVVPMPWRFLLAVLVGAGAYFALLHVTLGHFIYSDYPPPQWWRHHLHPRVVSSASWYVLIDAMAAILAAIPVALGVVLWAKSHRLVLSILVGVLPSLYIEGGGLLEYGLPTYTAAWIIGIFQFLSISLGVLAMVVLFSGRPLTIVGRGRENR
jgi:hypothetical protein